MRLKTFERSILACGVVSVLLMCGVVACSDSEGEVVVKKQKDKEPPPMVSVTVDQRVVVPSSVLQLNVPSSSRLVAKTAMVKVSGTLDGEAFSWEAEVVEQARERGDEKGEVKGAKPGESRITRTEQFTGDLVIEVALKDGLWAALSGGDRFEGGVSVMLFDPFGDPAGEGQLSGVAFDVKSELVPQVSSIGSTEVYLDELVPAQGTGFLRPEEGETVLKIKTGKIEYSDSTSRDLSGEEIALVWDGSRERTKVLVDTQVVGVKPGVFSGEVSFENRLKTGEKFDQAQTTPIGFTIQQSFISTLACGDEDPCLGASRGQRIDVRGRGLVRARGDVGMTLVFDGIFTPSDQKLDEIDFTGSNVLERSPERYVSDQSVDLTIWYDIVTGEGRPYLKGLGSLNGTFKGKITPRFRDEEGQEQDGLAWTGEFDVLPSKQVVYLKYLPRFSQALEEYGMRNVEDELRRRILKAAQEPYRDINVEFVDEPPEDFLDYATIELSGPDPYGRNAFGFDNSFNDVAKDTYNLFLRDYIGGWSQGASEAFDNPFGGIYIESFDYFSPKVSARENGGSSNTEASPEFDRILGPFMPELGGTPVRGAEWPEGPRKDEIEEALTMVSNIIGNTVAHEIGHSMGMAFIPADRIKPTETFHNRTDGDGALMDAGGQRSFEERAALGRAPATFNALNAEYLQEILPKRSKK